MQPDLVQFRLTNPATKSDTTSWDRIEERSCVWREDQVISQDRFLIKVFKHVHKLHHWVNSKDKEI